MFTSCLCGFSSGAQASSYSPETCTLGYRFTSYYKLPIGVNVNVNWCLIQAVPHLLHKSGGIGPAPHATPRGTKQ